MQTREMNVYEVKWLEQVNQIIESNIANVDFQLSDIVEEIYVSQTKLYRDIRRLTGISPNKYIRKIRLRRAKEILESGTVQSVAEVSAAVGFREVWYFSKLFYKEYNMRPGAYLKKAD